MNCGNINNVCYNAKIAESKVNISFKFIAKILICIIILFEINGYTYAEVPKKINVNNLKLNYAHESNVNRKLTPYIECLEKGMCNLYEREFDEFHTIVKKLSEYEYLFAGGYIHTHYVPANSCSNGGYASSNMVAIDEIKKYNINDNKFYLIKKTDDFHDFKIKDLNNNKLLLDNLKKIRLYVILKQIKLIQFIILTFDMML